MDLEILEIIKRIRKGDINAFKQIVDQFGDEITNLCYRYLNSEEDAHDAAQDVFLKSYAALESWEPRAKFKTWLYRIAINHCINLLRRNQKYTMQTLGSDRDNENELQIPEPKSQNPSVESRIIEIQNRQKIRSAVNSLPKSQRDVIILFYYQKLSYKEIAEILDSSMSSIESRIFRAKKALAKILNKT